MESRIDAGTLTPRELEVVDLIRAGRTNEQIATTLVISPSTAAHHVHNIIAKLGCANRAEVAAWSATRPQILVRTGPRFASRGSFIGRAAELAKLRERLEAAQGGTGGLVFVIGDPGIGKTRLTEEVATEAGSAGFEVLWGRCYEGDWAPPYVPFAEALTTLAATSDLRELHLDLGFGGPVLARIVPSIRGRLPRLPEPTELRPNEEQFRVFDAVVQWLLATARRRPVLFVIDDLHWADAGTLNMLRYAARFLRDSRICLIAAYRDIQLDRRHPLGEALVSFRRDALWERITLRGLGDSEVGEMVESLAKRAVAPALVDAVRDEAGGNPLFIREMFLHFVEQGSVDPGGAPPAGPFTFAIPESIREVIGRRLTRLSDAANRILAAASAFNGPFRFDIAAAAAELDEAEALDAVDAATLGQIIRPSDALDTYEFTHALIAHTLYAELSPSRQVRLHRRLAEILAAHPTAHPAEIAYQYYRSAALPAAEAGVSWALRAADDAAAAYTWEQVVSFCEMALELMTPDDERRAEVTGRLGLALPFVQRVDESIAAMKLWAAALFASEEVEDGLSYLMRGHRALVGMGYEPDALQLVRFAQPHFLGLESRASIWFRLLLLRHDEETAPEYLGQRLASPERDMLVRAWDALPGIEDTTLHKSMMRSFDSRAQMLAVPRDYPLWPMWTAFTVGEFREPLKAFAVRTQAALEAGMLDEASEQLGLQAACYIALGEFGPARDALAQAVEIGARIRSGGGQNYTVSRGPELATALDDGWEALNTQTDFRVANRMAPNNRWAAAAILAGAAKIKARLGFTGEALDLLELALPAIERAEGRGTGYTVMVCSAAWALWLLDCNRFAGVIAANTLKKVVEPDWRYPMVDGRLALAQLSALQGEIEEASGWFEKARKVLDEQGARPLRAICDFDEALALVRHSRKTRTTLDRARTSQLLATAAAQFQAIEMTGWIRRAAELSREVGTIP